tara:strand:- start:76 stop:372 length:297 start_codon:yes stop_codon:yes gene_type:complete
MSLDWIVDWVVDQIMRFVFYLADGFPAVDTLGATVLSGGALSSDENDDDDDHSNDDASDTSDDASTSATETENYCVVDGAEDTKSTEIPPENKDESTL